MNLENTRPLTDPSNKRLLCVSAKGKNKYILIPGLFAMSYLLMALQQEKLVSISTPFPSLVATTNSTMHHFPPSVWPPLYLHFSFKSCYKL